MAHNCTGDLKETLKWWQWGKYCFSLYETRLQQQEELNGQWMSRRWWWWWGDGGLYVVMEHTPKPQQKLRQTLHFSVQVVVGSGFFSFLFPLKI